MAVKMVSPGVAGLYWGSLAVSPLACCCLLFGLSPHFQPLLLLRSFHFGGWLTWTDLKRKPIAWGCHRQTCSPRVANVALWQLDTC